MIRGQKQINWRSCPPEDRFAWALQSMPIDGAVGAVTHPSILKGWSKHLVEVGFMHVDQLREMADENGMINIKDLPEQKIRHVPAFRGPRNSYNNAARWVAMDHPDDAPIVLPDVTQFTQAENAAILEQYRDIGMIKHHELDAPPHTDHTPLAGEHQ